MPHIILLTDLDDTLFASRRKSTPQPHDRPAAYLKDGSAISYASPAQQHWLAHWQQHALVVPVTARNHDSFLRVDIPFTHCAVIDYGGVVLNPDGRPDEYWLAQSRQHAQTALPQLQQWQQVLCRLPESRLADLNIRLIADFDIPFYLLVKSHSGDTANLAAAADLLRPLLDPGGKLHLNANNLAVMPAWLDKAHAVVYLKTWYQQQYGNLLTLGMGGSLVDLPFMQSCDFLIASQQSQISSLLRHSHL